MLTRFIILCCLFLTLTPLKSQIVPDLSLTNPSAQLFTSATFNIQRLTDVANYYRLSIRDGNRQATIRLHLEFLHNGERLWSRESTPFQLAGDDIPYFATGMQLEAGIAIINQQTVSLLPLQPDLLKMATLEEAIKSSGRLPAGRYLMQVGYSEVPGMPGQEPIVADPTADNTFEITNPTSVELIFPGASVSTNEVIEVPTLFPFFQWQSDVLPARGNYRITVYEKLADEETVADVFSKPPVLDVSGYADSFLQYPSGSDFTLLQGNVNGPARLLNAGRTYYWQVHSDVSTPSGTISVESDVFRFKISDVASASDVNYEKQILSILQQLLGPEYARVVKDLREQGYDPGRQIQLDGASAGIEDLLLLLSRIENGKLRVISAEVY